MRKVILLAGGAGLGACLGAGLMYVMDPERGRRRRAMLRDGARHAAGVTLDALDKKARDVRNRARGLLAEAGSRFRCEAVTDDVLEGRVRSQVGRAVSRAGDVEVIASEGRVTLRGVVRAGELERLLRRVSRVRGVREVESQLSVKGRRGGRERGEAGGEAEVNGSRRGPSLPSRLLATAAGGGLALYGARRRGVVGSVVGVVGMRMLARGLVSPARQHGNGAN
jgi:hypothetical protein